MNNLFGEIMATPNAVYCPSSPDSKHQWRKSGDAYTPIESMLTEWQKWATQIESWRWCPACNRLEYSPEAQP